MGLLWGLKGVSIKSLSQWLTHRKGQNCLAQPPVFTVLSHWPQSPSFTFPGDPGNEGPGDDINSVIYYSALPPDQSVSGCQERLISLPPSPYLPWRQVPKVVSNFWHTAWCHTSLIKPLSIEKLAAVSGICDLPKGGTDMSPGLSWQRLGRGCPFSLPTTPPLTNHTMK
jgi:hypothetical protein